MNKYGAEYHRLWREKLKMNFPEKYREMQIKDNEYKKKKYAKDEEFRKRSLERGAIYRQKEREKKRPIHNEFGYFSQEEWIVFEEKLKRYYATATFTGD